jgi:hypothetical protein
LSSPFHTDAYHLPPYLPTSVCGSTSHLVTQAPKLGATRAPSPDLTQDRLQTHLPLPTPPHAPWSRSLPSFPEPPQQPVPSSIRFLPSSLRAHLETDQIMPFPTLPVPFTVCTCLTHEL